MTKTFLMFNPWGVIDRDICLAAQDAGGEIEPYPIQVFKTDEGHTVERIDLLEVARKICKLRPDYVLCINGSGLDNDGLLALFCAYKKIPIVLWYVDEPFYIPEWGEKWIPETTVAFTFDRFYKKRLRQRGIPWVYTLPLAANVERLMGYNGGDDTDEAYRHDVVFVGGLDKQKIEYLKGNIRAMWPSASAGMTSLLGEAIREYRNTPMVGSEDVLEECARRRGISLRFPNGIVRQMVLSLIDCQASFLLRSEVIQSLQPCGVHVFGEVYWKQFVGEQSYGGPVDYYSSEIAKVYGSAAINLNISKYQLKMAVNQRVFDCPVCDGFLITDFREDLEEHFTIDDSVIVYHNVEDLMKKAAFYVDNPRKAKRVVSRAKRTVIERHTYQHRVNEMSKTVQEVRRQRRFSKECENIVKRPWPPKFERLMERLEQMGENRVRARIVPMEGKDRWKEHSLNKGLVGAVRDRGNATSGSV